MNKKKKNVKTTPQLVHPTQVELAEMIAKAKKEAEEAIYRVESIKGRLQEIIDEASVTSSLIPFIQPQETEGLINIWSSGYLSEHRFCGWHCHSFIYNNFWGVYKPQAICRQSRLSKCLESLCRICE
jgi:hypothetical protein